MDLASGSPRLLFAGWKRRRLPPRWHFTLCKSLAWKLLAWCSVPLERTQIARCWSGAVCCAPWWSCRSCSASLLSLRRRSKCSWLGASAPASLVSFVKWILKTVGILLLCMFLGVARPVLLMWRRSSPQWKTKMMEKRGSIYVAKMAV